MKRNIKINLILSFIVTFVWILIDYIVPSSNKLSTSIEIDIIVLLLLTILISIGLPFLISLLFLVKNKQAQIRAFVFLSWFGRIILLCFSIIPLFKIVRIL